METAENVGRDIRKLNEHEIAVERLPIINEFLDLLDQNALDPKDVVLFMGECKKAAARTEDGTMDWGQIVNNFLWLENSEKWTYVDICASRNALQKLDQKGIHADDIERTADIIQSLRNNEVADLLKEVGDLKTLRMETRKAREALTRLDHEAAEQKEKIAQELKKKEQEIRETHKELDEKRLLSENGRKLDAMGWTLEVLARLVYLSKKNKRDPVQLLIAASELPELDEIANRKKQITDELKKVEGESREHKEVKLIYVLLEKKGYSPYEIKRCVERFVNLMEQYGDPEVTFSALSAYGNLKAIVEDKRIKTEERDKIITELAANKAENGRLQAGSAAILAGVRASVDACTLGVRQSMLDLTVELEGGRLLGTAVASMESPRYPSAPRSRAQRTAMVRGMRGITRAHLPEYKAAQPDDPLCIETLLETIVILDHERDRYLIPLSTLLGEACPLEFRLGQIPFGDIMKKIHASIQKVNVRIHAIEDGHFL